MCVSPSHREAPLQGDTASVLWHCRTFDNMSPQGNAALCHPAKSIAGLFALRIIYHQEDGYIYIHTHILNAHRLYIKTREMNVHKRAPASKDSALNRRSPVRAQPLLPLTLNIYDRIIMPKSRAPHFRTGSALSSGEDDDTLRVLINKLCAYI